MSPPSATPWKVRPVAADLPDEEEDGIIYEYRILNASTNEMARTYDEANALLIVQAVNERAGLLASNQSMREALELIVHDLEVSQPSGFKADIAIAQAALSQARG